MKETVERTELKRFFTSSGVAPKDKVISLRVEEALFELLEELTEEWKTGSVSMTLRIILSLFLIPAVYEEEWKRTKQENLSEYLELLKAEGEVVELQRFKQLLEELSKYKDFVNKMNLRLATSISFFEEEIKKVEEAVEILQDMKISWNGEMVEKI